MCIAYLAHERKNENSYKDRKAVDDETSLPTKICDKCSINA